MCASLAMPAFQHCDTLFDFASSLLYAIHTHTGNFAQAKWHGQHGGDGKRRRADQFANRVRLVKCPLWMSFSF
jgi:hypothetical protein